MVLFGVEFLGVDFQLSWEWFGQEERRKPGYKGERWWKQMAWIFLPDMERVDQVRLEKMGEF